MKKVISLFILTFYGLLYVACVQKTTDQNVLYKLNTFGIKNIKSVGIKGSDKPLNWNTETKLNEVVKDSLYELKVTYKTGYLFTQVKFVVNGEMELPNQDNRRIEFSKTNGTIYTAKFNVK